MHASIPPTNCMHLYNLTCLSVSTTVSSTELCVTASRCVVPLYFYPFSGRMPYAHGLASRGAVRVCKAVGISCCLGTLASRAVGFVFLTSRDLGCAVALGVGALFLVRSNNFVANLPRSPRTPSRLAQEYSENKNHDKLVEPG